MTHICVGKLTIIGSYNGLSPQRRQAIIWTNAGLLLIGPSGTNFNEMLIAIHTFSVKKIRLKMSYAKWCPFRLGLNVLNPEYYEFSSRMANNQSPGWILPLDEMNRRQNRHCDIINLEYPSQSRCRVFFHGCYIRSESRICTGKGIYRQLSNIRRNPIPKHECFSSRLAVVFAQSIEARY